MPGFQKVRKQRSRLRSCTLCVQGSAQKQDVAEPLCRPPSLTLSVHSAREGPTPRAQVSSLWALPCPLPGVPILLRAPTLSPSPHPLVASQWPIWQSPERRGRMPQLSADALVLVLCPLCWPPQPPDLAWACWGWRALAIRLAPVACPLPWDVGLPRAGWGPLAPHPLLRGCRLATPLCLCPPPVGGSAFGGNCNAVVVAPHPAGSRLAAVGGRG